MKTIKSIFLCMLALVGVSCTNDNEHASLPESKLCITAKIASTRAVIESTTFESSGRIGLCLPQIGYYDITAFYNPFDKSWTMDDEVILTSQSDWVYAYYPYTGADVVDGTSVRVDIRPDVFYSNYLIEGQADYLYGMSAKEVNASNPDAYITFRHALARVTLSLTRNLNDAGFGHLSRVELAANASLGNAIALGGVMDMQSGEISPDEFGNLVLEADMYLDETAQTFDLLVIPCTLTEGSVELSLTIDGQLYRVPMPAGEWVAGQQYTYPIDVSRRKVPQAAHESVYMGFDSDDGQPLYWATMNLGASSVADDGGHYGWGDPTGKHTEQWINERYSDYVEDFNACLPYYGGVNAPANISGTEFDLATAMWGENWRTPSATEFYRLIENCQIEEVPYEVVDGVEYSGSWFVSRINGNRIFIPKSRDRFGDEVSNYNVGEAVWTSSNNSGEHAFFFSLQHLDDYLAQGRLNIVTDKCYGLPIRPVTSNPE